MLLPLLMNLGMLEDQMPSTEPDVREVFVADFDPAYFLVH